MAIIKQSFKNNVWAIVAFLVAVMTDTRRHYQQFLHLIYEI